MRVLIFLLAALLVLAPTAAGALTADEVIRLKKAGVSDETIQKMLEQEAAGGAPGSGPVSETSDEVVYQAGQGTAANMQRNAEHERWKEEKAMDMLQGTVLDLRGGPPANTSQGE